MTAELMTPQVRSLRQWRAWLAKDHTSSPGVCPRESSSISDHALGSLAGQRAGVALLVMTPLAGRCI